MGMLRRRALPTSVCGVPIYVISAAGTLALAFISEIELNARRL